MRAKLAVPFEGVMYAAAEGSELSSGGKKGGAKRQHDGKRVGKEKPRAQI